MHILLQGGISYDLHPIGVDIVTFSSVGEVLRTLSQSKFKVKGQAGLIAAIF